MRSRILSDLKLGKQAPSYKAAAKALDLIVVEARSHKRDALAVLLL
jgi:hypothetical protein